MRNDDSAFDWREAEEDIFAAIDITTPYSSRIWDYWPDGKDHFPIDSDLGAQISSKVLDVRVA